jgi:acyl carrier protein
MFVSTVKSNIYQLTPTSHFSNDLGLDSLDTVEVVMAIEEVSAKTSEDMYQSDITAGVQH